MSKKELGQFYTTNYEKILNGMSIPEWANKIIEPFAGSCELLKFVPENKREDVLCYDISPVLAGVHQHKVIKRDTLLDPPDYTNFFILTNPPYLARNKSKDKIVYEKYNQNDLFKCFIKNLIENISEGGILIVPLNFFSSIRKSDTDLRKKFLSEYRIELINIFEEKIFDDTGYTVCSFQFIRQNNQENIPIKVMVYRDGGQKLITVELNEENNYTIGGELYNLSANKKYKIGRLVGDEEANTNIFVKCIDDNIHNKICMKIVDDDDIYRDSTEKSSARSYLTLTISPNITKNKQKKIVEKFNTFLSDARDKYDSLFLTNYREGGRKRISFELIYNIVKHILIEKF